MLHHYVVVAYREIGHQKAKMKAEVMHMRCNVSNKKSIAYMQVNKEAPKVSIEFKQTSLLTWELRSGHNGFHPNAPSHQKMFEG